MAQDSPSQSPYPCDLCQLPVEVSGFRVDTVDGPKHFCCEGCLGVYRMLNGDRLIESSAASGKAQ